MDGARIAIDHIAVTLPGEADGIDRALEAALVERLSGWRPDLAGAGILALGDLDLGSVTLTRRLDPPALAAVIADRLVERLDDAVAAAREQS